MALANDRKAAPPVHTFDPQVEEVLNSIESKLGSEVPAEQKRFFAIKMLEKDDKIQEQMKLVPDVSDEIKKIEEIMDDDTESIITNERYTYISSIIEQCFTRNRKETMTTSDKIDRIVTNRFLALPIFAAVMFVVYYVSVSTIGTWAIYGKSSVYYGPDFPQVRTFREILHTDADRKRVRCAGYHGIPDDRE